MAEMATVNIWNSVDAVDTWPCDFTDCNQPVEHFEFVPIELREQVRVFFRVHMRWLGSEPRTKSLNPESDNSSQFQVSSQC